MNILVFSDSHGQRENMQNALSLQIKKPDAVIFLGDGLRDTAYLSLDGIPFFSVSGNCDASSLFFDSSSPVEMTVNIGGKRIFMTHGHKYSVKNGYGHIISEAVRREADILLFGHTHECLEKRLVRGSSDYGFEMKKDLCVMNPGSIGYYPNSWGCIEINPRGEIMMSHGALL